MYSRRRIAPQDRSRAERKESTTDLERVRRRLTSAVVQHAIKDGLALKSENIERWQAKGCERNLDLSLRYLYRLIPDGKKAFRHHALMRQGEQLSDDARLFVSPTICVLKRAFWKPKAAKL